MSHDQFVVRVDERGAEQIGEQRDAFGRRLRSGRRRPTEPTGHRIQKRRGLGRVLRTPDDADPFDRLDPVVGEEGGGVGPVGGGPPGFAGQGEGRLAALEGRERGAGLSAGRAGAAGVADEVRVDVGPRPGAQRGRRPGQRHRVAPRVVERQARRPDPRRLVPQGQPDPRLSRPPPARPGRFQDPARREVFVHRRRSAEHHVGRPRPPRQPPQVVARRQHDPTDRRPFRRRPPRLRREVRAFGGGP